MSPYTVALVLDPEFGEKLATVCARVHAWAIDSPKNREIFESLWKEPACEGYEIETGVTIFKPKGVDVEDWCVAVIDQLDMHHNHYSHDPPYSVLEVYGARLSERIREEFGRFGLVHFEETSQGFIAKK